MVVAQMLNLMVFVVVFGFFGFVIYRLFIATEQPTVVRIAAYVSITVIAAFVVLMLWVLAPAMAADLDRGKSNTCAKLQAAVASYGESAVISWARWHGYSEEQIAALARRCFGRHHSH